METYQADSSWRGKLRRRTVRPRQPQPGAGRRRRPWCRSPLTTCRQAPPRTGAAILERQGLRGSFYVAARLAGSISVMGPIAAGDAVRRLSAAGHEIGCHTYFAPRLRARCRPATAVEDVARNAETLRSWGLPRPTTFAYPFGDVSPAAKARGGAGRPLRAVAGRCIPDWSPPVPT